MKIHPNLCPAPHCNQEPSLNPHLHVRTKWRVAKLTYTKMIFFYTELSVLRGSHHRLHLGRKSKAEVRVEK